MSRPLILAAVCCSALFLLLASSAQAIVECPHGDHQLMNYHYNPAGAPWNMPGDSPVNDEFTDDLDSSSQPWHWETSLEAGATPMFFGIIFRCYGMTLAGILSIPANTTVYWDIHQCGERPEVADHRMRVSASQSLPEFVLDTSIVEGDSHANVFPAEWQPATVAEATAIDHITIAGAGTVPTLSEWGMVAFFLLLVAVSGVVIFRRRSPLRLNS